MIAPFDSLPLPPRQLAEPIVLPPPPSLHDAIRRALRASHTSYRSVFASTDTEEAFGAAVTSRASGLMLPEDLEFNAMPFTPDPCMDWIRAHGAELARYAGRWVLIDANEGIVKASDDPRELEQLGVDDDDLLIHFVRPGLHAPLSP